VRFETSFGLVGATNCNCSRRQRLGWVMGFAPREKFSLLSGETALTEYVFRVERIRHQFCKVRGIEPFALGMCGATEMAAVNVNCLEGVDPRALPSKHVDARSR